MFTFQASCSKGLSRQLPGISTFSMRNLLQLVHGDKSHDEALAPEESSGGLDKACRYVEEFPVVVLGGSGLFLGQTVYVRVALDDAKLDPFRAPPCMTSLSGNGLHAKPWPKHGSDL